MLMLSWLAFPQSLSRQELFSNCHTKLLPPIGHMCTAYWTYVHSLLHMFLSATSLAERPSSPKYIAQRESLSMHHHVEGLFCANATSKSGLANITHKS